MMSTKKACLCVAMAALVLAAGLSLAAASEVRANTPGVLPTSSNPGGQSYGEWAADWWSWVLSVPVDVNPLLDTSGQYCDEGQSGSVWFLAGSPGGDPVIRECSDPAGKMLFVPIENLAYMSWPTDPYVWDPPTEQAYRDYLDWALDTYGGGLVAEIDGDSVANLGDYRGQSPVFYSEVPDDNYINYASGMCGKGKERKACSDWLEGDLSGPHLDDGTYLMLAPLSAGEHTIHVEGWNGNVDVTYYLTVAGE